MTTPDLTAPQHRAAVLDAVAGTDVGAVVCRAVPVGERREIWPGFTETFHSGVFERASKAPHRVKLRLEHDGPIVGVGTSVYQRGDAIWAEFRFARTLDGQEARTLALDGIIDQVSVTFAPDPDWTRITSAPDGTTHADYYRAQLVDVSLVASGAYDDGAVIESVRTLAPPRSTPAERTLAAARAAALERLAGLTS